MNEIKDHLEGYPYCPARNAGYEIIKHTVFDDLDGTKLGTVLGKNESGNFVTWQYSYFPKTDFFNGFNHGYYFGGAENEYNAELNFHNRNINRMKSCVEICNNSADKMTVYVSDLKNKIEQENELLNKVQTKHREQKFAEKIIKQPITLFSIEQNGEVGYYQNSGNLNQMDIFKAYASAENPWGVLMDKGKEISCERFAEIEQSDKFAVSVDFNIDEHRASIYTVHDNAAEEDRTGDNSALKHYDLDKIKNLIKDIEHTTSDYAEQCQLFHSRLEQCNVNKEAAEESQFEGSLSNSESAIVIVEEELQDCEETENMEI